MNTTEYDRFAALWTAGNNAGNGFAPVAADENVEDAVEYLAGPDGVLHTPENTDEIAIVRTDTGAIVGIGDSHGAWAVALEPAPAIVVGSVTREHGEPAKHNAYVAIDLTIGGEARRIGAMVGARESNWGSIDAGAAMGSFLTVETVEESDLADLPAWARTPVLSALYDARRRLWAEVEALRA